MPKIEDVAEYQLLDQIRETSLLFDILNFSQLVAFGVWEESDRLTDNDRLEMTEDLESRRNAYKYSIEFTLADVRDHFLGCNFFDYKKSFPDQ